MNKLDLLILVQGKERASIVFNFEGPVKTGTSTSKYRKFTPKRETVGV